MSGDTLELVEVWKCPTCGAESMHAVPLESNPICFHCSDIPNYQYLKFVERRRVDPNKEPVWRTGRQRSPGEGGLVRGEIEAKRIASEVISNPGEELVGVTTIKEYEQIEEIKGSCPKCGGPLEFREHVDAFNEDGSPIAEDTCRDPYCPSCKLLWLNQEAEEKA